MGSSNLQQIKRRMRSIESTKKITNAMELIATAKLKTWRDRLFKNREYVDEIFAICHDVFSRTSHVNSPYLQDNSDATKTLYIVITSSLGLCASYNYEMYRFGDEMINKQNDDIIVIGTKGFIHYKSEAYHVNGEYSELLNQISYSDVHKLSEQILNDFADKKYKRVELLYTTYKNSLTFIPTKLTLLPLNVSINEDSLAKQNKTGYDVLMEPSPDEVAELLIPMTVETTLFGKIIESQVSEQACRRTAMENATDNAKELIDELQLEYNKARQSSITQEITEIVAGSL